MIYIIGTDNGEGINWLWIVGDRTSAFDKFKQLLDGESYQSRNVGRYIVYHGNDDTVLMVSIDIVKHGRLSLGTVTV